MRLRFACVLGALLPLLARSDSRWVQLTGMDRWERETVGASAWITPEVRPPVPFRELVASWNLREPSDLEVEVQAVVQGRPGRWWSLGRWSPSAGDRRRSSIPGQRDSTGRVDTDTLVLATAAESVRVRVRFADPGRSPAALKRLDLAFWSPDHGPAESEGVIPARDARQQARVLEVPRRSQADDPEGVIRWCSPTSLSMLLAHWAARSGRPDWDRDMRTVAAGVHDPGWPGTGNWSFNVAYAGSVTGLQAAAVRLGGVSDLAALVDSGIPVAASVSYAVLKGKTRPESGDGHLVVVCGLSDTTVTVNDPGVRLSRVRREFPLSAFRSAWEASHRTAYVVWPEGRALPSSPLGTW